MMDNSIEDFLDGNISSGSVFYDDVALKAIVNGLEGIKICLNVIVDQKENIERLNKLQDSFNSFATVNQNKEKLEKGIEKFKEMKKQEVDTKKDIRSLIKKYEEMAEAGPSKKEIQSISKEAIAGLDAHVGTPEKRSEKEKVDRRKSTRSSHEKKGRAMS